MKEKDLKKDSRKKASKNQDKYVDEMVFSDDSDSYLDQPTKDNID
jgi:hypothetical protein